MKKLKLMPLVLSGVMITGCMSLEERLASNDASVRRYAEYELVQQTYKKGSQQDRLAAIGRISDPELLFGLAMKSNDNTAKEGVAAVQKLTDAKQVLQVAKTSAVAEIGVAALTKVSDSSSYADIAQSAKSPTVRAAAYEKIEDQGTLLSVVRTTKDKPIKLSAIKRVTDKEKLLPIVFEPTVDAELVDAFISNCQKDDILIKMVMACGAKLSAAQCAKLLKKSANPELKDMVASVSDLKVVEKIRTAKPDEYKALLESISNIRIKNSACAEILLKGLMAYKEDDTNLEKSKKYGDDYVRFTHRLLSREDNAIEEYIGYLSDQQIADVVLYGKIDGKEFYVDNDSSVLCFRKNVLAAMSISSVMKLFPKMLALRDNNPKEGGYRYDYICDEFEYRFERDMSSDQKLLIDFIKETNGKVLKEKTVKAIYQAVGSPEAAEAFLNRQDITTVEGLMGENWQSEKVLPWMASLMLKVSQGEKERVLSEAQKDLERNKDAVRVGPFYVGMPYYEATLVAEKEGLYAKKGDLITLYFANDELGRDDLNKIAKNWRKNLRVAKIVYTTKAALKYLDCEDAVVLQQAIKQCVKKESGKAKSYDYVGEIKHDIKVDTSTRINLFSPTGTSVDVDSEIWSTYTNTRLGVKLMYGEKSGVLVLEAI